MEVDVCTRVYTASRCINVHTHVLTQNTPRQANDHIIYAEDFFDPETFAAIKARGWFRTWRCVSQPSVVHW